MRKGTTKKAESEWPSAESLREIPPTNSRTAVTLGRGEEGLRMARGLMRALRRGRPKKGEVAIGTASRSVRLPTDEWKALEQLALERKITPNTAMREAIVHWIARSQLKSDERATKKPAARTGAPTKPASSRARTSRARAS
jgi:predicted transcriptional regulator